MARTPAASMASPFHRFRTTPPKGASSDMPEAAIREPRDGAVRNIA